MATNIHNTKVNLAGLLEVLGKNLYSTPSVAIRELIQNSHDACMRDQYENVNTTNYNQYSIRVSTNLSKAQVTIEDNGSGLTDKEIIDFLATVGSGYTRLIRGENSTNALIGYFGLGFLSAYVVADKVELWTTSYKDLTKGWYFSTRGGHNFSLSEVEPQAQHGSKVVLTLKNEYCDLSDSEYLSDLLKKYCCLLPIDIFLNSNSEAVNTLSPPWVTCKTVSPLALKKQQLYFATIFENNFEPICVFPLKDNDINTHGLIWMQDSSGYSTSDYRNVSVFIRNMFITQKEKDLLPLWAGFTGCVINSESLTPTASRESIQTDGLYCKLQALIEESLLDGIKNLAVNEKRTWRRVLSRHNEALLGAAVSNNTIFNQFADDLKLATTEGTFTPKELLKRSNNKLYLQIENQVTYETVLFRAQMIPVIFGYFFAVSSFCYLYAKKRGIELINLGTKQGNQSIFPLVDSSDNTQQLLEQLFCHNQEILICTQFTPEYIPIVLVEDQDVLLKQRLESDESDKRIGTALLGLARQYTQTIDDSIKRRIFVNMNSSLIHHLLGISDNHRQQLIANMLRAFVISLSHGGESFDENQFAQEIKTFTDSLKMLTK
jgi:molecular chaperone HtpG